MTAARVWLQRTALFVALLALGWLAGSALRSPRPDAWRPRSGPLRVLTTIFPIYDFVREVGGPDVEVINLLPPGVDPHEFALSPRDIGLVAGADVIIANGAGLDDFVSRALRNAGLPSRTVVNVADGIAEENTEGGLDPHLWLDPVHAREYVARILRALGEAAPSRRAAMQIRAERYIGELTRLDTAFRQALTPLRGRSFIAFHGAFSYLARRYGLNIAAVWESSPGRDPGAREVREILRRARSSQTTAAFTEPQFSPRALDMIAADAHIPVYTLDPLETARDFRSTHYLAVMRKNLTTLQTALTPPALSR